MTDPKDDTADAGEKQTPVPRKKMTYQDVVEAVITRSDEDRAWTLEQNGLVQKQIAGHTAMLAEMFANQQKNQVEDRRHQQETITELATLVRTVVAALPTAPSTAAGDHEEQATQPATEDTTATQNHSDPDESGAAASDGAPATADTEDGGGSDAEGAVEGTATRSDEEHRPAPAAGDDEPARADPDDTAGKPAATREGNDPPTAASDKTQAAAVEGESEDHATDHDEEAVAAGEEAHTEEDDAAEEVVESTNGEEAEPGPDRDTKPATTEADPETIVKPLRAIAQKLTAIEDALPDGEHATKENMGILDALALIREATDKHTAWISSLVGRLPLPAAPAGTDPGGEITPTEKALLTVMNRLDDVVLILNGPPPEEDAASAEEPTEQPPQLDPGLKAFHAAAADLSRQITTDRSNYRLLVWAGAGIAAVAIPLALALGILVQQQLALVALPDPTLGWKDRVWASVGPTLAQCMSLEDAGAGDCIVSITTPGE